MCGFSGVLGFGAQYQDFEGIVRCMTDAVKHRGPDSGGYWADSTAEVALGHRRLAVMDPSPAGVQPMQSASGNWVIALNGEIYNHRELRRIVASRSPSLGWRGDSDTETVLACLDTWGVSATLSKLVGMFSMALWSVSSRTLTLVRDRFGEKPLYYSWVGRGDKSVLVFGSELRSLELHPAFRARVDRRALGRYMRHLCVSDDDSIAEGVRKVPPGHFIEFSLTQRGESRQKKYWDLPISTGREASLHSDMAVISQLDEMLRVVIRGQMLSDVPIGAFLSGGVDSSTVVAIMQSLNSSPIKTFSIGFGETDFDEAPHAKAVARHLGTDHTELYISPDAARAVIPELATIYDEPFADSSQIPTLLLSRLAHRHVKVSLSGDGGDEVFGGYNRHILAHRFWPVLRQVPVALREVIGRALLQFSPAQLEGFGKATGLSQRFVGLDYKLQKAALVGSARSEGDLYSRLTAAWLEPIVLGVNTAGLAWIPDIRSSDPSDVSWMMRADIRHYLSSDILVKLDRAAMSTGLETRTPFLDHRLVEWVETLPLKFKIRRDRKRYVSKWALRQVLSRYVPPRLIERPKMGFGVPLAEWLRGPLRPWAEDLLDPVNLRSDGFIDCTLVRRCWDEHQARRRDWGHQIWCVLMFQSWRQSGGGRHYS